MALKYELIYFAARGRAEPIRIMFNVAGVKFKDTRFSQKEWNNLKSDTTRFPLRKLPVLLVDNKVIPHSHSINKYVARNLGFYGNGPEEMAQIDVISDTVFDFGVMLSVPAKENYSIRKKMLKDFTGPNLIFLEQLISQQGDRKNLVGNKMSLADILTFHVVDLLTSSIWNVEGVMEPYPNLAAFCNRFKEDTQIKTYLESRPDTVC